MKFFTSFAATTALFFLTKAASMIFTSGFDDPKKSVNIYGASCTSYLLNKGFTTFGSLPSFPNTGGGPMVTGLYCPNCGTCVQLTFMGNGVATSVVITVIDHSAPDFNISTAAMNTLTGRMAVQLGRVPVSVAPLPAKACGL